MKPTKSFFLYVVAVALLLGGNLNELKAQSGVFAGGPIYYGRDYSIDELKYSGFTHLIVWTIHIKANGDLDFNGEFLLCSGGEYVGHKKYPNFASDIAWLKQQPGSIKRIEFGLSAWGSSTFDNVKTIMETQGTGEDNILYKNFKALKEAIPEIDALNNDDEGTYDRNSTIAFSVMCADLGYKMTLCPYTYSSFWSDVADSVNKVSPGTVDAVYLQCYAGGGGNNPCTWENYFADSIPVWPGIWTSNPTTINSRMSGWKTQCGTDGGWLWLYDDFDGETEVVKAAAGALNEQFGIEFSDTILYPATSPSPKNGGTKIKLDAWLSWNPNPEAESRNLYFGTTSPPDFIGNQDSSTYDPGPLTKGTTYYWKVDEIKGTDTTDGREWVFTAGNFPGLATNPSPAVEAIDVSVTPTLSFTPDTTPGIKLHKLYLDTINPPSFYKNLLVDETSYTIENHLEGNTLYYWRIDEVNNDGKTEGAVWSFTTGDSPESIQLNVLENNMIKAYPNPFNNSVKFVVNIKKDISANLAIYNISGQLIHSIHGITLTKNNNAMVWDGTGFNGNIVPEGLYYVMLISDNYQAMIKISKLK